MAKFSRDKGVRGERLIARKLHGKRIGVAFASTPVDVVTDFADYQVKNYPLSSGAILDALKAMARQPGSDGRSRFVVWKPRRGTWLIVETMEQHIDHHVGGVSDAD
uniref:Uncharacterized protein n=1 Tax=viral metagenome TaxID=1070528 RepID=A0A6M3KHK1_9ZZZZ